MGITFPISQSAGTFPVLMDLLYNISKYGAIEFAASFNTLHGIKSGPVALLGLMFFSCLMIPGFVAIMGLIYFPVGFGSLGSMNSSSVY